ncbi:hypothetical protein GQ600_4708 [Phytophthora cactorum]|nr:hypothetical protein GQ600_4708 [Phytophthora cactorum]
MEAPRRQNHYTVKLRREALERVAVEGCKPTARALNISLGTLKGWRKKSTLLFEYKGARRAELQRARREKQDHIWTRLGHLHEGRTSRGRGKIYLCTGGMIEYMKMEQGAWLEMYLADKSSLSAD